MVKWTGMVVPFSELDPNRLRQMGLALTVVGVSVLSTKALATNLGMTERMRAFTSIILAGTVTYSIVQTPGVTALLLIVGGGLAVLAPAAICLHLFVNMFR